MIMENSKKEHHPHLSIIMPVYNAEKWIKRTIQSVISQSYKDFEFIIVLDCCTDNCESICKEYAIKDNRIVVKSLSQNVGVSTSSNVGIDLAKGDYIAFLDHDDIYLKNAFETMINSFKKEDDLAIFGALQVFSDHSIKHSYSLKNITPTKAIHFSYDNSANVILFPQWGKLFRKEIIDKNNVRFDESIKYGHDVHFCFKYLFFCKSVSFFPDVVYEWHRDIETVFLSDKWKKDPNIYYNKRGSFTGFIKYVPDDVKTIVTDSYCLSQFDSLRIIAKCCKYSTLLRFVREYNKVEYKWLSSQGKNHLNSIVYKLLNTHLSGILAFAIWYKYGR